MDESQDETNSDFICVLVLVTVLGARHAPGSRLVDIKLEAMMTMALSLGTVTRPVKNSSW